MNGFALFELTALNVGFSTGDTHFAVAGANDEFVTNRSGFADAGGSVIVGASGKHHHGCCGCG